MTALHHVIGTPTRTGLFTPLGLLWAACAGCIPIESDLGGTRPPPVINDDTSTTNNNVNFNAGDEPNVPAAMVFDVTIVASSLSITGITVDATLTVVPDADAGEGQVPFEQFALRDTFNDFGDASDTIGISGGIFLIAATGSTSTSQTSLLDLSVADDGTVTAVFRSSGGVGHNPNRFVLQSAGNVFDPGVIGITYQVQSGSQFSFRIDGDRANGELDLIGTPISEIGTVDTYVGTFSGSLRR